MPLDDAGLLSALQTLLETSGGNSAATAAQNLASAIETYVKSATVNVTTVSTIIAPPGTAGGPCTGSASGSLS